MTRVARCIRCGELFDMKWSSVEKCNSCNGRIEVIDVDLGRKEGIPRTLNIIGGTLLALSFSTFVLAMIGVLELPLIVILFPVLITIPVLGYALFYQGKLVKESMDEVRSKRLHGRMMPVRYSTVATGGIDRRDMRPRASKIMPPR